ncbi:hypothetical protein [Microvirga lenta]|uniref:hypothetical protein n=1 Tax=Microvirga lenta TaxID=2881337 RepID=UPI001CFF7D1A|nr:hypothetical protein [Microvirga lenta]MCB5176982.1 hypothetical protein [Microvirga lenta]
MEQIGSTIDARPDMTGHGHPEDLCRPSFLDALLDPAAVFRHPAEVVDHPWFTDEEKRTILLSWVRDELVIEQVSKGAAPDLTPRSRIDDVIEALSRFDPCAAGEYLSAAASIRARHLRGFRRRSAN